MKRNFAKVYSRYQRKLLYMELVDSARRVLLNDALPASAFYVPNLPTKA